ncbi:rhomboid family intramembrane serine protease [Akkermansia glycaniphila]|uniref:rhomboid family intramembrane serine protease n=1 Tax=Akkermansia glycaniphila TaxID=1679444 RepID=UPI001C02FD7D|nr:rhomboid family intramembrane serine protease [Akkermansia glycaniphila]MBT9449603.1 rhomboid family intramembrane serine protease [Akkermansia glycaniphila]
MNPPGISSHGHRNGCLYEYGNSTRAEPNGPFTLDEMAALRCRGYVSPSSYVRMNGGEWQRASECGIPISYPKADYPAACVLVLLLLAVYCLLPSPFPSWELHTVNGQPNIWTCAVDGQWWRIFTGTFSCTGILSLGTAAVLILSMGARSVPFVGRIGFLLLYMLCGMGGMGGSLAAIALYIPEIETSYGLCHLPLSGVVPGCYGLMGAAIVLGGWRSFCSGTVWSWGAMIMLALPYYLLHLSRHDTPVAPPGVPMAPSRKARRMCLAAIFMLACAALADYMATGSESAILDEELAYTADDEKAAELLVRAASNGFPYACEAAAYCYMDRPPLILRNYSFNLCYNPQRWTKPGNRPENPEQAAFWMEKAAMHGFPEAQYETGKNYMNGFGVDKDAGRAVYWLDKAVRQGNRRAAGQMILWKIRDYLEKDSPSLPYWLKNSAAILPENLYPVKP